jgi:hypothetical protein
VGSVTKYRLGELSSPNFKVANIFLVNDSNGRPPQFAQSFSDSELTNSANNMRLPPPLLMVRRFRVGAFPLFGHA